MRGFPRARAGLLLLLAVALAWFALRPAPPTSGGPAALFRFEEADLIGFSVERPDGGLTVREVDGTWRVDGQPWRPGRATIRRVAHQLHDLDARAALADPGPPEAYGFGPDAPRVTLWLRDGRTLAFEVGDPNPTGVSWYVRPLPGDTIHVVKKSAMELYRLPLEAFREDRFAAFDADEATRISGGAGDAGFEIERIGPRRYRMVAPVVQDADADVVLGLLGRVAALRATAFVADAPEDLSPWGLHRPAGRVRVELASGATLGLAIGDPVPERAPPERWLFSEEDRAVYAARDGLLDELRRPPEAFRDRTLVRRAPDELRSVEWSGPPALRLERDAGGWRRSGGGPAPQAGAERLAETLAGLSAEDFPDPDGAEPPGEVLIARWSDGGRTEIRLGGRFVREQPGPPPLPGLPASLRDGVRSTHQRAWVDGVLVQLSGGLSDRLRDLAREAAALDATPAPE